MTEPIIPLADARYNAGMPRVPANPAAATGKLTDARARTLRDLRISVTDRCNFRCSYCMPPAVFDRNFEFLPHSSLLTFEEIARMARIFAAHGVEKIRITGGEPLLRRNIEALIGMLAQIRTTHERPLEITLTTNASLLARKAATLAAAGLRRVTVSLDALDDTVFRAMNSAQFPVADVLAGIDAAAAAGLGSIKVNMVVKRGVNEQEIVPMARHFRGSGHIVRFIEFMDVGASNGWRLDDVVPSSEVIARISEHFPLEPRAPQYPGEVAARWRYLDGSGEIGVISSVSEPFCSSCNRARLSTEGKLFTCLFATAGHDLRALVRGGFSDEQISGAIAALWSERSDRYSEIRSAATSGLDRIEMSYIGG